MQGESALDERAIDVGVVHTMTGYETQHHSKAKLLFEMQLSYRKPKTPHFACTPTAPGQLLRPALLAHGAHSRGISMRAGGHEIVSAELESGRCLAESGRVDADACTPCLGLVREGLACHGS